MFTVTRAAKKEIKENAIMKIHSEPTFFIKDINVEAWA